jgi:hypothetical protein
LNFNGLFIGLFTFLIIGIFHPIVIKSEYYFGKKIWPLFLIIGIVAILISINIRSNFASPLLSILGFSSLWSIHEIYEQEERVKRGWFPKNPKKP